jgi:KDO2-lipid IV(A) lauroyltransferase
MPARLAQKFHCDLVPVQVERLQDARYRVTFHPPVRPTDTSVDETAQAINMIQQVHRQFEDWIRQQPQDWFCSKRLWWRAKRNPWNSKKEAGRKAGINRHAA